MYNIIHKTRMKVNDVVISLNPQSIVDICCGTGTQLKMLVERGYDAIGVDSTEAMLEVARKGKYAPKCYQQDATNLQFDANSFDVAMLSLSLHEKDIKTAKSMVNEAYRVLKKGKYLLVIEFCLGKETTLFHKGLIYFIEKVSGKEHYENFLNYKENSLLDNMISKNDFDLVERYGMVRNGMEIRVYKKL